MSPTCLSKSSIPNDSGRYLTPQGSAPFETRQETIAVRGAPTIALTIRSTRHGPVLSDALPPGTAEAGYVLALAATFLTEDDRSAEALWYAGRAGNWDEFRAAFESFVAPQQNIVFGDTGGEIGFIAPGRVPVRGSGNGWLPVPGWTGEYDWTGFIPFAELPQGRNPASGHFVSANNKIVPDSYPYFLSRDWDLPNRAERIGELLAAEPVQSPEASAAIQADTLSIAGAPPGAADEPHRPAGRSVARGDRAAAALGLPDGRGRGGAAAVYRLAARLRGGGFLRPPWRRRQGLLEPAPGGHRRRADRPPGMVRRAAFRKRRRGEAALSRPAIRQARNRTAATRCLPRPWTAHWRACAGYTDRT